ncbi:MAG: hypothetical protein JXQ81_09065 [Desulfuromonadales bacterium]|nr:hypothetical protein [Desulfuromonadales bacterium]MBN2792641.1 hypothetical protein [Desulfuromonadales bacterium]
MRLRLFIGCVAALVIIALLLSWANSLRTALSAHILQIDRPNEVKVEQGEMVQLNLYGGQVDEDAIISLVASMNHNQALIDIYPVEGIYNSALIYKDILYLGSNKDGLKVLDVSRPTKPRLLGEYLPGSTIVDIRQQDDRLYLSCGTGGVVLMQIEDEGRLLHLADIETTDVTVKTLFLNDSLVVAAGSEGVLLFDQSRSSENFLVGSLKLEASVKNLTSFKNVLYVLCEKSRVHIYKRDEDVNLVKIGILELSEPVRDFAVHGGKLYVATSLGLDVYSLDDPLHPRFEKNIDAFGSADKIYSGADSLYVIDSFSRLSRINSKREKSVDDINLASDIRTLAEKGQYLYLAGSNRGLMIVDRSQVLQQADFGTLHTRGSVHDIYKKKTWIYVADKRGGVLLKNLEESESDFQQVSPRWSETFFADDKRLFVAQGQLGSEVFDISNPGAPQLMKTWPGVKALRLSISNGFLVVTRGLNGIEVYDIEDMNEPVLCDQKTDFHALDVAATEEHVYIAAMSEGLKIYALGRDGSLVLKSELTLPFPMNQFAQAVSVVVQDDMAYVANGRSGLMIVDVANSEKPQILSLFDIQGFAKGIAFAEGNVFVSSQNGGVTVVDVRNPRQPLLAGRMAVQGLSRGILVDDGMIYVARNNLGLTAIPVPLRAQNVDQISSHHLKVDLPAVNIKGAYDLQISSPYGFVSYDRVVTVDALKK